MLWRSLSSKPNANRRTRLARRRRRLAEEFKNQVGPWPERADLRDHIRRARKPLQLPRSCEKLWREEALRLLNRRLPILLILRGIPAFGEPRQGGENVPDECLLVIGKRLSRGNARPIGDRLTENIHDKLAPAFPNGTPPIVAPVIPPRTPKNGARKPRLNPAPAHSREGR